MNFILEKDRKYLWHPYTQHGLGEAPLVVRKAYGAYLELEDGRKILDAISSWWVNLLGHCHPGIQRAIHDQSRKLEHVLFAGCTHQPATDLAETLILATLERGASFSRVFYSDNGSTAVEVALKMAFQFHKNKGDENRTLFLALNHSYHGDTFGAMAVGEPNGFHPCFRPLLPQVEFVEPNDLTHLKRLLKTSGQKFAAFILEPMIQGAGGMRIYSPEFLVEAVTLCQKHGILVIFDEVFTGFFRTGKGFAFEHAKIFPDFLCLSKGITGGFLPLAVTLTREEIFQSFSSNVLSKAFLHGHSYTANPIACAAALATWTFLNENEMQLNILRISESTHALTKKLASHPAVQSARSLGTVGVVETKGNSSYFANIAPIIRKMALEKGVLLRPLGNVIYCVPPYCISDSELSYIFDVIKTILDYVHFENVSHKTPREDDALVFEVTDV